MAELVVDHFITDNVPNVQGLILAGCADLKVLHSPSRHHFSCLFALHSFDYFSDPAPLLFFFQNELYSAMDPRLKAVVLTVVDIQYNGVAGFNECVEKCSSVLKDSEFFQERRLLARFFEMVKTEEPVVYGVEETMRTLAESGGAVETLLVSETSDALTALLAPLADSTEPVRVFGSLERVTAIATRDRMKILSSEPLLPWLLHNAKRYSLHFLPRS